MGAKPPWEAFRCLGLFSSLLPTAKRHIIVCQRPRNLARFMETCVISKMPFPACPLPTLLRFSPNPTFWRSTHPLPTSNSGRVYQESSARGGAQAIIHRMGESLVVAGHSLWNDNSKMTHMSLQMPHTHVPYGMTPHLLHSLMGLAEPLAQVQTNHRLDRKQGI